MSLATAPFSSLSHSSQPINRPIPSYPPVTNGDTASSSAQGVLAPYAHCLSWWMSESISQITQEIDRSSHSGRWKTECTMRLRSLYLLPREKAFATMVRIEKKFSKFFSDQPTATVERVKKLKNRLQKETQKLIGGGWVHLLKADLPPVQCVIQKSMAVSDITDGPVTVFTAYIPGEGKKLGQCTFSMNQFAECPKSGYQSNTAVGILRLDSFLRETYRGVGTLLMQAAMEYGIRYGTGGRVALHSEGSALGFYYKLGMRSLSKKFNAQIEKELEQAKRENRAPADITDNDAMLMYLPEEAMAVWTAKIRQSPVLHEF